MDSTSLARFAKIIKRQQCKLLTFVGIAMGAAVAFQFVVPKVYQATALVKVDRHTVGEGMGESSSATDMDKIVATQIEMAQSDPLLRAVVERYNLLAIEMHPRLLTQNR